MDIKKKIFSTREAISFGWDKVNDHLWFFIPVILVLIVVIMGLSFLSRSAHETMPLIETLLSLLGTIINIVVTLGFIKLSLSVYHGVKPTIQIVFSQQKYFFRYFFASILYSLIVFGGLILFVIPGIIWSVRFRFFGYAMVDKDLKTIESLKESHRMTKGLTIKVLIFSIAIFGINILGLIPFGVGLLVTIPISIIAIGYVWKKISEAHTEAVILQPKELEATSIETKF